jgi:flagellar M-ring protein FliF
VIDETGKLLADGASPNDPQSGIGADDRKSAFESRLRQQVEAIVTSVVGPGHARVQLTADFDLNRITQTSDKYDPDGRVMRSSQTREEQSTSSDGKEGGPVSASNELPGQNKPEGAAAAKDQSKKTEEIVNYEISRVTKTEVIEAGRVNRISAAVLVDGVYTRNDKGEMAYAPRAKEEIDRIAALVRSAIGFDAKRGDQVEVVNLRFAENTPVSIGEPTNWMTYLTFTKDDIMRGAELGVMALLGLIVLLMVVRPLVRRIVTPDKPAVAQIAALAGVAGAIGVAVNADGTAVSGNGSGTISSDGGANISIVGGGEQVAISNRTSAMIDVAKVQGQVHAQSVQKVGELAEKNPQEAVSIIRGWLHEDAA